VALITILVLAALMLIGVSAINCFSNVNLLNVLKLYLQCFLFKYFVKKMFGNVLGRVGRGGIEVGDVRVSF
jgi:hypothetical protein